jgi:hypothetical protein
MALSSWFSQLSDAPCHPPFPRIRAFDATSIWLCQSKRGKIPGRDAGYWRAGRDVKSCRDSFWKANAGKNS